MRSLASRWFVQALIGTLLTLGFGVLFMGNAEAQSLQVDLAENPFSCDGGTRTIGTVSGFAPGESIEFQSPQLNGVFSTRTADDAGVVAMKWTCDQVKVWNVTVRGLTTGASGSFVITGAVAPPPADAPLGAAFDAKSAMTTAQMAIWKDFSPYNGVGIYMPVTEDWDNRADKDQVNLTSSWVSTILADGWRIIPIYVGHQAPASCAIGRFVNMSGDGETARSQGRAAAVDAVSSARGLGLPEGSPIYLDIEGYRPGCGRVVIAYIEGWTASLREAGFQSGVYGSQSSVMTDLTAAARQGGYTLPDAVWVSTDTRVPGTLGLDAPPDDLWTNARIHQYRLSVTRTYGGVTREVDDNIVDAPLATYQAPIVDNDGDGHGEPEPDNCDGVANPSQVDLDGDGDGDACDTDVDGDGVTDPSPDNCDRIPNADQADLDGDGDGDACDGDIDGDFVANVDDPDPRDANVPTSNEPVPTAEPTAVPAEPTVEVVEPTAEVVEPTAVPAEPTARSEAPTALPTAPPVTPPEELPSAIAVPVPSPTPSPVPAAAQESGSDDAQVFVLPSPEPTVAVTPEPPESIPLAESTVTITTEDDSNLPWRTIGVLVSAVFAAGFGAQAVRSWRTA